MIVCTYIIKQFKIETVELQNYIISILVEMHEISNLIRNNIFNLVISFLIKKNMLLVLP